MKGKCEAMVPGVMFGRGKHMFVCYYLFKQNLLLLCLSKHIYVVILMWFLCCICSMFIGKLKPLKDNSLTGFEELAVSCHPALSCQANSTGIFHMLH